ncbi:MAG: 1-acyl-sn-glycerol-3-phosphate acyltransferase [Syntrophales bacterium]|nr:1-acyl-sn-glycerol-3-phosphate acyltransferase [Syntrophales bacterium]
MVDLEYLKKINLTAVPKVQIFIGTVMLKPNYEIFRKVEIVLENLERIPKFQNCIFAMNHTDRFNYWPFQYKLWRLKQFNWTTVWVKGKYYRNALLAKGLDLCNLIPVPSMGYLIEEFYKKRFGERIDREQYRRVRDAVDGKGDDRDVAETERLFGKDFIGFINDYYEKIMARVAELTLYALMEKNLSLIIFPEGTRGKSLGEGKTGIAQVALHTGKPVVPVGCNNSDVVYPGSSPFAKSGRIVYRIGEPLTLDDKLKDFKISESFNLLSRESQRLYKRQFEGATQVIMESINELLDPPYRRTATT